MTRHRLLLAGDRCYRPPVPATSATVLNVTASVDSRKSVEHHHGIATQTAAATYQYVNRKAD